MYKQILSVTPSGTTGAATGSASVTLTQMGELHGIYIDYTSVTNVTVVRLQLLDPAVTLFERVTSNSDAWYFPRAGYNSNTGFGYGTAAGLVRYPLVGTVVARVSTSTPTTNGVKVYAYIDEV